MIPTVISSFKIVDPALLFNRYQSSLHASVRWISSVSTLKFVEEIVNLSNFILAYLNGNVLFLHAFQRSPGLETAHNQPLSNPIKTPQACTGL